MKITLFELLIQTKMVTFIYDKVRNAGNIGTMIRNTDLLVKDSLSIVISPLPPKENEITGIKRFFIQMMELIGFYLFGITSIFSLNELNFSDEKFSSRMKRNIRRFACISKNGKANILYDPKNLDEIIESSSNVWVLENGEDGISIHDFSIDMVSENDIFVMGGEGKDEGVTEYFLSKPHKRIYIPTKNNLSINVSCAHAIICSKLNNF